MRVIGKTEISELSGHLFIKLMPEEMAEINAAFELCAPMKRSLDEVQNELEEENGNRGNPNED